MSDLRNLYQDMIIDHGRHPRNFGELQNANRRKEGFNPLCGDKIILYIREQNGVLEEIFFEGSGCAISMASASLLTETLKGKTMEESETLFNLFHRLVTEGQQDEKLGKLTVLGGVSEYPSRVKCAILAWHTLKAILINDEKKVSTE